MTTGKPKPPRLRVYHSKAKGIMYQWDAGIAKTDAYCISNALSSLFKTIEERGFDIATLRISVRRKDGSQ